MTDESDKLVPGDQANEAVNDIYHGCFGALIIFFFTFTVPVILLSLYIVFNYKLLVSQIHFF